MTFEEFRQDCTDSYPEFNDWICVRYCGHYCKAENCRDYKTHLEIVELRKEITALKAAVFGGKVKDGR